MKFLYVGDFKLDWSTEWIIADHLMKAGHQVIKFQDSRHNHVSILNAIREHGKGEPCVLLFTKFSIKGVSWATHKMLADILMTVKRETGMPIVCWQFDLLRKEYDTLRYEWACAISKVCDLFLTTDSGLNIPNNTLLRQGCPGPYQESDVGRGTWTQDYGCDLAHVGGIYSYRRSWLYALREVSPGLRVFSRSRGDVLFDVCKSSKIIVGPPYPAFPGYWSNRLYGMTGYGACFACPEVPGMAEEGWIPDVHYAKLPEDTREQIPVLQALLQDEEKRKRIAEAGQRFTFANHTFKHRVKSLVEKVGACLINS